MSAHTTSYILSICSSTLEVRWHGAPLHFSFYSFISLSSFSASTQNLITIVLLERPLLWWRNQKMDKRWLSSLRTVHSHSQGPISINLNQTLFFIKMLLILGFICNMPNFLFLHNRFMQIWISPIGKGFGDLLSSKWWRLSTVETLWCGSAWSRGL